MTMSKQNHILTLRKKINAMFRQSCKSKTIKIKHLIYGVESKEKKRSILQTKKINTHTQNVRKKNKCQYTHTHAREEKKRETKQKN